MLHFKTLSVAALLLGLSGCGGGEASAPIASTGSVTASGSAVVVTPAAAPNFTAMTLGAATHFQQGWNISALQSAKDVGAGDIRDEISWDDVEQTPGNYAFTSSRSNYIDTVATSGLKTTLLLTGGNRNYDGGNTPYTDAGRAAFAKFAVAVLDRFPSVKTIEIGNEYNGDSFVNGPVKNAGYGDRQNYYALMLKAVHDAVKAKHADVKILGGAAHSIPVGYYKVLFDKGALDNMDGIVIHPYTTEPEQFARQIQVLKTAMGSKQLPIYATEYAREIDSETDTADYLVKMTAAMAASGVTGADWYALRQEGPANAIWYKKVALTTFAGVLTQPGQAFKLMTSQVLNQGAARQVAIDDFTYGYSFGDKVMVLWGAPRTLSFSGSAKFYNARGEAIAKPDRISQDSPIVIVSDTAITYGGNLTLGASGLVADSYDQFDYQNTPATSGAYQGRWAYYDYSVQRSLLEPMSNMDGGEVSWTVWTPYIGSNWRRPFFIHATSMAPVDFGNASTPNVYKAALRFTAARAQTLTIKGTWDVQASSVDGVDVTVQLNGRNVLTTVFKGHYDMNIPGVSVNPGDRIDFILGPNATVAGGDITSYRIKIYGS